VVLLAGRIAEHVVFRTVTTGGSDDLRKVNEISRAMVAEYGMGSSINSRRLPADDYSMSDATRRMIDEDQAEITDLAHQRAMELVVANRPLLDRFAERLLERELLERADIEKITAEYHDGRLAELAAPAPLAPRSAPPVAASQRLEHRGK